MTETPNLGLPFIVAAQAQKHVTHNEAIRALDAIVQPGIVDRDLTSPPGSPADGDRYIVADAASGEWSGKEDQIAAYQDNAWIFYVPREGWIAWVADEDKLLAYDGVAWVDISANSSGSVNPTPLVGVNATADAANRLSVNSPATLFNHDGSNHQLKINKASTTDTATVLFQTGFSGRAEMGISGDDDYHFKVSPDGSSWKEAIVIDRTTGTVGFPNTSLVGGSSAQTNLLINGNLSIDQRGFAGGILAAGTYGHDRWKAAVGGADYDVTAMLVTLNSGELEQIIEPSLWGYAGFASTQMTLSVDAPSQDLTVSIASVSGTITSGSGRRFVTLTTGSGDGGDLTIRIKSASGGVVSFSKIKLETGSIATDWQGRPLTDEVPLCQRYFTKSFPLATKPDNAMSAKSYIGYAPAANFCDTDFLAFPIEMRAIPTVTIYSPPHGTPVNGKWATFVAATGWTYPSSGTEAPAFALSTQGLVIRQTGGLGTAAARAYQAAGNYTADAEL